MLHGHLHLVALEARCMGRNGLERGQMEIVFPLPMAVLMKVARLVPVRVWAAAMSRANRK